MHIAYLGKSGVEIEHMGGPSLSFPEAAPSLRRLTFLFLRAVQRGQVSMKEARPRGICRVALWPLATAQGLMTLRDTVAAVEQAPVSVIRRSS